MRTNFFITCKQCYIYLNSRLSAIANLYQCLSVTNEMQAIMHIEQIFVNNCSAYTASLSSFFCFFIWYESSNSKGEIGSWIKCLTFLTAAHPDTQHLHLHQIIRLIIAYKLLFKCCGFTHQQKSTGLIVSLELVFNSFIHISIALVIRFSKRSFINNRMVGRFWKNQAYLAGTEMCDRRLEL